MQAKNTLKVTIVGTGYVGITTGLSLAYLGHKVTCVDKNPEIISKLQAGQPTIHENGLDELLEKTKKNTKFTTELSDANGSDVYIIAVGTPCKDNGDADLVYVESVAKEIGNYLPSGKKAVIVNKSTVPIGSAKRVETVIKERLARRGVEANIIVASNPEFLREGIALNDTFYPDRIVVGADDVSAYNTLRQLYAPILEQTFTPPQSVPRPQGQELPAFVTTSTTSAELIKYAANSFLAMKISFINEFAGLAERVGADIKEVARGIGLDKRIGANFLAAGAGWGGSCFPKDTKAIIYTGSLYDYEMPLVDASVRVNTRQRKSIVEKMQASLKVIRGNTIGILGLAFKPETDDLRDSPAIDIIQMLTNMGARVKVYDPVAMDNCRCQYADLEIEYATTVEELVKDCDAVALITDWKEFAYLDWGKIGKSMNQRILIDGRNMLDKDDLEQKGFMYIGIGR